MDSGNVPTLALVGRPNVGKSSLFNRLTGTRQALVHDMPGVTRDRLYGRIRWGGRTLQVIDTGGLVPEADTPIEEHVRDQVDLALDEAQVVLFVVDGREGLVPLDEEIALRLRKKGLEVLLVVNKVDQIDHMARMEDFRRLGFPTMLPVSAAHGFRAEELLAEAVGRLPEGSLAEEERAHRIAIVGKPNVGKSSLVNRLIEDDRLIVSDEAGTTREAIEVPFRVGEGERPMVLVDTAGLRRRARIKEGIEKLSRVTTERALRMADLVVLLVDGSEPLSAQDRHLAGMIRDLHKPAIVAINKIDRIEEAEDYRERWLEGLDAEIPWFDFVPRVFLSVTEGKGVAGLLSTMQTVLARREMRLPTPFLNREIRAAMTTHPPAAHKGRTLRLLYVVQKPDRPATFVFKVNDPEAVHFSFRRYLENVIRGLGDFEGVPLTLRFEERTPGRGRRQDPMLSELGEGGAGGIPAGLEDPHPALVEQGARPAPRRRKKATESSRVPRRRA